MLMQTDADEIQIKYRVMKGFRRNEVTVEVNDLTGNPVAVFNGTSDAATWLNENNFTYVQGTSGVWSRKKDSAIQLVFGGPMYGGRAMVWDWCPIPTQSIYRRRSIFAVDGFTTALTLGLCALVLVYYFFQ